MQRLFDIAITDRIFSEESRPAFERYLTDAAFRVDLEGWLLMPHRVSLETLASGRPDGIGDAALKARLYDMRFRFRDALSELRREHTEHPSRPFSGRAGRPSVPSPAVRQTGEGVLTTLSSGTSRHQHTSGETA